MEQRNEDPRVARRLASLEPQWQPNLAQARAMLDARLAQTPRYRWTWLAAAAAAGTLVVAALLPAPRAVAQKLWDRIVLNRVDVVRVDLSDLPMKTRLTVSSMSEPVRDVDDAERKAGFRPNLPAPAVISENPAFSVTGTMTMQQTIHVRDIETALAKVGAKEVQVPADWEGVTLRAAIGPIIAADYANAQIMQCPPIEVAVPPGFPLEQFAEVAFRSIGISFWEARAMGHKFVTHPAWFLDIPPDEKVNIQEQTLRGGPGLVIEDFDDNGATERVTVILTTSKRVYAVSSKSREVSIRLAAALP